VSDISITKQDVLDAQKSWADGIVDIGRVFLANGDYKTRAIQHIKTLYAYDESEVMFKPSLASDVPFRKTYDHVLSYFVGGEIPEDKCFAIRPWSKVRFGEQQIVVNVTSATAMGNYFFTPSDSDDEMKLEFTFGYLVGKEGRLIINLNHSSIPYQSK
jgi:hypothetical protein